MATLPPHCSDRPRVFVTGMGVISPMGHSPAAHLKSIRSGATHFKEIDFFDVSRQRVKTAGVVEFPASLGDHQLSKKELSRLDRGSKLMLYATGEAIKSAQLSEILPSTPMVIGTSAGAMPLGEDYYASSVELVGEFIVLADLVRAS